MNARTTAARRQVREECARTQDGENSLNCLRELAAKNLPDFVIASCILFLICSYGGRPERGRVFRATRRGALVGDIPNQRRKSGEGERCLLRM